MAVAFGRIRSKSRFLSRSALRKKPQSDKKKKAFKIKKLAKEKHKSLSLDHLYQNQNQGTTTCKHVVQHGDPEEQQNLHQQLHFHHHHSPRPPSPQPPKKRTHLPPSEHANTMGESSNHQRNHSHTFQSSRLGIGLRNSGTGGGQIVEVQGGHIVRSTGRKDRHSKVCTAKGPRDRRVRLAAHTAIQFYDVQDRLGYDRPSKAVDWLIKNAKSAIDELAELPAWNPITTCSAEPNASMFQQEQEQEQEHNHVQEQQEQHRHCIGNDLMIVNEQQGLHQTGNGAGGRNAQDSSFLPPSLDSDAIADTIKSFFPMGASAGPSSSAMQFQSFPTPDLLPRSTQSQDLRLSLQSFPDPAMLHHHNQNQHHQNPSHHTEQPHSQADHVLLSGIPLGFGGNTGGWPEQQVAELNRLHRLGNWNTSGGDTASGSGVASAAGYLAAPLLQQMFSHNNQFYSQRGPLQSSNTPSVRAWIDPAAVTIANSMADHNTSQQQQQENQPHHRHHPSFVPIYPSSLSGIGFSSGFGGFSGFHIPARIQGDEEEHDGYSDKPSSASSDSRH